MMNTNVTTDTTSQSLSIGQSILSEQDARNMVDTTRNVCVNQIATDNEAMGNLRIANRSNLYILLGTFCDLSFKLLDPANEKFLEPVLADYGLKPAPKGQNPFRPLADMLFGEWVREIVNYGEVKSDVAQKLATGGIKAKKRKAPTGTTATRKVNGQTSFFVPNRSAEKYAKVARYAHSQQWKPGEIAQNIDAFKGKMEGVLKADTKANKGTDAKEMETQQLVDLLFASDALSVLDISDCGIGPADAEKRTLVSLWAEIKDGDVLIRGVLPTSEDAIHSHIRKYANDNAAKIWKQKALEGNGTAG